MPGAPWRIRDRATFEALRRSGVRSRRGPVTVTFLEGEGPSRVAYAIGKRTGGAVVRNRLRRRLRSIAVDVSGLAPGAYLIGAGPEAAGLRYEDLKREVAAAMRHACRRVRP